MPVDAESPFLTRTEYNTRNAELLMSLASLLNEYGTRRDVAMDDLMQDYFLQTMSHQESDYRELNRRIDALGVEFLRERSAADLDLEDLLEGRVPVRSRPQDLTPTDEREE